MADKRKLQGEIDRCTKKVSEGLDTFEDLWKKVTTATNVNIKEKHEADLKKEIKKLQRFRDSIKSWLTNPEVKDKSMLIEHKRLIETKMEMFKVVERETKTKAYSKEGLTTQSKVDPKEKEKEDVNVWISQTIETLKIQIDQFECELENSSGRRKKADKGRQGQLEHCKEMLDKHKVHIEKLETIMRLLDNDALQLDQIQSIREDVDYYSQSNQDDSFQENAFIYDDLHLDEISASLVATTADNVSGINDDDHSSTMTFDTNSSSCSSPTIQLPHHHHSHHHHNFHYSYQSKDDNGKERIEHSSYLGQTNICAGNNTKASFPTSNHLPHKTVPVRSLNELTSTTTSLPSSLSMAATGVNYAQVASIGVSSSNIAKTHSNNSNLNSKPSNNTQKQQQQQSNTTTTPTTTSTTTTSSPSTSPRLKHNKLHALNLQQQPQQQQHFSQLNYSQQYLFQQQHNSFQKKTFSTFDTSIRKPRSLIEQSTLAMTSSMAGLLSSSGTGISPYSYVNSMNNIDDIPLASVSKKVYKSLLDQPSSPTSTEHSIVSSSSPSTSFLTRPKSALSIVTTSLSSSYGKSLTPTPLSTTTLLNNWNKISTAYEAAVSESGSYVSTPISTTNMTLRLSNQPLSFSSVVSSDPYSSSSSYFFSNSTTTSSSYDTTLLSSSTTTSSLSSYHLSHLLATTTSTTPSEPKTLHISPILGVTPLGPTLLTKQHSQQLQLLDAASLHLPQTIDSSKIRAINSLPMPYKSPGHYTPPSPVTTNKLEFYLRLNPETLFYAFYYLEGSLAQLLAAKALKQLSWRFHKKLLIWFQRHEDPRVITEEYEQGSYLYFDFERWTQSTIEKFIFEYRYLEDRDLH